MKFLSREKIERLAKRAEKHGQRNNLRKRYKNRKLKRKTVEISAPEIFSLARNYRATVDCLHRLKRAALLEPPKGTRRIVSINFDTIKETSTASALVLAAEIDRWRKVKKVPLRPKNTRKWEPSVKRLLVEIGFFDLLNVVRPQLSDSANAKREITILPVVTGNTLDIAKLALIEDHLRMIANAFQQEPSIYGALIEAAYNVIKHGYPEGYDYRFPTIKDQWWATGSWSPGKSEVKLIIYDQGVGIAETLPLWDHWEKLNSWLSSQHDIVSKALKEHANMIEAALEVSRTSGTPGSGQGLRDVVSPVDQLGGGRVRILSGKGQVLYEKHGKLAKVEQSQHLGGTLIEWTIPVP